MCDNVSIIMITNALKKSYVPYTIRYNFSFLDKYEFLRTKIIKIILRMRSIYNAYKTLFTYSTGLFYSTCGNVYNRLDYETHATDRLKLCVIYKYGNITYKAR